MANDLTHEHERALLSCALLGGVQTARTLLGMVQAPMLNDAMLARVWSALRRVLSLEAATPAPIDLLDAVATELGGDTDAPSLADLHDLTRAVPSAANATYYAQRVIDHYVRREATGMIGDAEAERTADMATADLLQGIETRAHRLRKLSAAAAPVPLLHPAVDFADVPQPAPVLWRDHGSPDTHDPQRCDAVLSIGEVALLSAAGGLGKSTATLEIASAAAAAADLGLPFGAACGLRAAPGPVVLVSYEDAPTRIVARLHWSADADVPAGVVLWPDPEPLWTADLDARGASRHGPQWDTLWREVRATSARLVVIDPVSAALADVSTTETGPVRAFLRALTTEASPNHDARWAGCGVLLVAHDTKSARDAVRRGEDPGAGVVAGSAAWYDGARGVLTLLRDPRPESTDRLLECVKANYGRTGWGARLSERTGPSGAFYGLEQVACLDRSGLEAAKKGLDACPYHPIDGERNPYA